MENSAWCYTLALGENTKGRRGAVVEDQTQASEKISIVINKRKPKKLQRT